MKIQITFRSGAQVEVDVDEVTTRVSPITGQLLDLKWIPADRPGAALLYLAGLGDIVAVVATPPDQARPRPREAARMNTYETAEAILVAHQRRDCGSCLCGWSELGKSHPAHQVAMLREADLLVTQPAKAKERDQS